LYAGRLGVNEQAKFMQLFAILDKQNHYNEAQILEHKTIAKKQLSNLKGHLYKQILISLRLNPIHQNIRLQIREQLDFATILYHKGLFGQSLKMLERAKGIALEHEEKNMAAEIIELEKVIESQYITRSTAIERSYLSLNRQKSVRLMKYQVNCPTSRFSFTVFFYKRVTLKRTLNCALYKNFLPVECLKFI